MPSVAAATAIAPPAAPNMFRRENSTMEASLPSRENQFDPSIYRATLPVRMTPPCKEHSHRSGKEW
jgi:hypothetical protein